jgi:UDP-N-acetylglucosamine acyltransferase
MNNKIEKSAIIGSDVKIGSNNYIGHNVVLDGNITIGSNNIILHNTVISNTVLIGDGNSFFSSVSIGSVGEMGSKGDRLDVNAIVIIGNNNTIREFSTINSPVRTQQTEIGNNCYLMARTHVPHDAILKNNVVMATNSLIGGGCILNDYAYLGLGSLVHQWLVIGESVMVGMNATISSNVPPFCIVTGTPARISGINKIGLERRGFDENLIVKLASNLFQLMSNKQVDSANELENKILDFVASHQNLTKLKP